MFITSTTSSSFGRGMVFASSKMAIAEKAADSLRTISFSLPAKKPNQMVDIVVSGDIAKKLIDNSDRTNITLLKYKVGEEEKVFQNKKGFSEKRFREIQSKIQKQVDESINFLYELIKAQHSYNK